MNTTDTPATRNAQALADHLANGRALYARLFPAPAPKPAAAPVLPATRNA